MKIFHKIFAFLDDKDVVQFIQVCESKEIADAIASDILVNGKAVDVTFLDVHPGDFYRFNKFYRSIEMGDYDNGYEVDSTISLEEELSNLIKILNQREDQIQYLENLLKENGLGKLIE